MAVLDCAFIRVNDTKSSVAHLAPVCTVLIDHLQGHLGEGAGTLVAICQPGDRIISLGVVGVADLAPHQELKGIAALSDEDLLEEFTDVRHSQLLWLDTKLLLHGLGRRSVPLLLGAGGDHLQLVPILRCKM